ncbi:KEOPS complex Pcc1-like subunit [Halobacteriales archaeon SW_12_69_24]|jgi:KEOPS complex subunit Pcc1|nr:MAG: KEOPS complex Pcc1-like subunit [Halobacteriales archaeon SW_12_69_24]
MPPRDDRAHAADLRYEYGSGEAAVLVADAVRQEVGEIGGDRSTATIERDGRVVRVDVAADDLVALRAGLNTWQTLVGVAGRTVAAGDADEPQRS